MTGYAGVSRRLALLAAILLLASGCSHAGNGAVKNGGASEKNSHSSGGNRNAVDTSADKPWNKAPSVPPLNRTDKSPAVEYISPAAPDILAVTVIEGTLETGGPIAYEKLPDDQYKETRDGRGILTDVRVIRNGKEIGSLVGGPGSKLILMDEHVTGDPLQLSYADYSGSYTVACSDDPNYSGGIRPVAVYRKSKPVNMSMPENKFVMEHNIYLKLPSGLAPGKTYTVSFGDLNVKTEEFKYIHEPEKILSQSVHSSQAGYRPDDPVKRAFLSIWFGTGGFYDFGEGLSFSLIDEASGEKVYSGKTVLDKTPFANDDYSMTYVYSMDFGDFNKTGRYRLYVEGVGNSYPFEIGGKVWEDAFKVSMKGFYHNRSGIKLGPPYTDYVRPRPYYPGDGMKVYQSATSLLDSGNGLNAKGTDTDNFGNLIAGKTDRLVPDAWGGYFDAGDWDRRIQHLSATRYQLELLEMYPDYFEKLDLNIPESGDKLPDIMNEALWNIDFYKRLQTAEGGIRGGIEAAAHPNPAETSWEETLPVMAYAPDHWSSYIYAGVAARAAFLLREKHPGLAAGYGESAIKAMEWAEREYKKWLDAPETKNTGKSVLSQINDERNLAAVELYRLTGNKKWHGVFLETTLIKSENSDICVQGSYNQRDAAFVYARLEGRPVDAAALKGCRNGIMKDADTAVSVGNSDEFNINSPDRYRYKGVGYYSTPDAAALIRAHFLTGKQEYLAGIIKACLFGVGANPLNMTYTTGLGSNFPKNPLHIDSRRSGQSTPAGITVYGNFNPAVNKDHWMFTYYLRDIVTPLVDEWPVSEAYFDIFLFPEQTEWTINQTLGPTAYAWGYLAARK